MIEVLAEEVAKHINGGTYSEPLQADVTQTPKFERKPRTVECQTYPYEASETRSGKGLYDHDPVIAVLINRKLDSSMTRGKMLIVVDEIASRLRFKTLNGYSWQETAIQLYDFDAQVDDNVFVSLLRISYRKTR